jgi:hypothetical protein
MEWGSDQRFSTRNPERRGKAEIGKAERGGGEVDGPELIVDSQKEGEGKAED